MKKKYVDLSDLGYLTYSTAMFKRRRLSSIIRKIILVKYRTVEEAPVYILEGLENIRAKVMSKKFSSGLAIYGEVRKLMRREDGLD